MTKYLVIDSNNFIEPLEGGFKNAQIELEDLKKLKDLVEDKSIHLLLPEIVKLEVERLISEKRQELKKYYSEIQSNFNTESQRVKIKSNKFFQHLQEEEEEIFNETTRVLEAIFSNSKVINLPLDEEILVDGYKRVLSGKKPFNKDKQKAVNGYVVHSIPPDAVLLESVKSYFRDNDTKDYKVIICTRDPDWREEEGNELDPQIRTDFKDAKLYFTLRECLRTEYSVDLPPVVTKSQDFEIDREDDQKPKPPVPIEVLIDELEKSSSFDTARRNMSNLLNMKRYLTKNHLRKILKAMFSNPYNYTINQVMAVDVGEEFSKKLYLSFKDEAETWKEFADNLLLLYGKKYQYLEDYEWLFDRLGINYKEPEVDDIPF